MLALVLGAVRARTAQVLTILALTAVATAVAAAGPWFAVASIERATATDLASVSAAQRAISIRQGADTGGDLPGAFEAFTRTVRERLPIVLDDPVYGAAEPLTVHSGAADLVMVAAYRERFCANVRLDGPCPAAAGDAAISQESAQRLGIGRGDPLVLRSTVGSEPVNLRVVALYTMLEPDGLYWSNDLFRADSGLDPVFTPAGSFTHNLLRTPTLAYDASLPAGLIRGDGGFDLAVTLRRADQQFTGDRLRMVSGAGPLLDTLARDRATIIDGVTLAAVQTLILTWFAIGMAGRYTGRDRRPDVALLKLRGVGRLRTLRLLWGQHLLPLLLGALAGAPIGFLLARWLAGPVTGAAARQEALLLSGAAVAAVLVGGLLVLAAVEVAVLRLPVLQLLQRATGNRADWLAGLADLALIAVAVAAIYQARTGGPDSGLAMAAPGLFALAVGLLLARTVSRAASRAGGAGLRAGRLRFGLTAVRVARQPGTDRVFALIVVAVALFVTAAGAWNGERVAREQRSTVELGAPRVLTVQVSNRTALMHAVRTVDPGGREAMAVAVDSAGSPPVLAVDSARYAAVTGQEPVLAAGDADAGGFPLVTGERLAARVNKAGDGIATLHLYLLHEATGAPVIARFGVLPPGERTVTATVRGCTVAPGCRIVRWELSRPLDELRSGAPAFGTTAAVRGLDQVDPAAPILTGEQLGDIARWRAANGGAAVDVSAGDGELRLGGDRNATALPQTPVGAWAIDTALPLPIAPAGLDPESWRLDDPSLFTFGGGAIPVRPVDGTTVLPVLGRMGVLVDLEATRRLAAEADPPADFQVWLAADARPGIVDDLAAAGLDVISDETVSQRAAQLGDQGPAAVVRFGLLAGVAALLLAAAAIAVAAAVDRDSLSEQ
ncbi:FtsX-like permease family protein, partial [Actinoplanes sp. NPDC024001]|uniref:FtsX-like permease family protein n=1 Tax=Actinoplanes sp. NPDC024001 TaxID=3154598 RepID=UPI0033C07A2C